MRRRGLTLLEVTVIIAILLVLVFSFLPAITRACRDGHGVLNCADNLSQLWKVQNIYMQQYGGAQKRYCDRTGGAFWTYMSQLPKPLIDSTMVEIYACPFKGVPPGANATDYMGPAGDVKTYQADDLVGADKPDNHGKGGSGGGNVLRKSGDVQMLSGGDPVWLNIPKSGKLIE